MVTVNDIRSLSRLVELLAPAGRWGVLCAVLCADAVYLSPSEFNIRMHPDFHSASMPLADALEMDFAIYPQTLFRVETGYRPWIQSALRPFTPGRSYPGLASTNWLYQQRPDKQHKLARRLGIDQRIGSAPAEPQCVVRSIAETYFTTAVMQEFRSLKRFSESKPIPKPHDAARLPRQTLSIAYTPDSDDAFNFYAWEHGRVKLDGFDAGFHRDHIIALNRRAAAEYDDLVAISSVVYPSLADRYWILETGNSVGRGYGPVLASKYYRRMSELVGKRIAVAGIPTTGAALAAMYCPNADFIELPYDRIADAVVAGQVDAGVMIHEELLFFPEKGLQRVCDLGRTWCEDTQLPLPVGLNVCHRRVGRENARRIVQTCHASLAWAHDHFDEAFAFASRFGRGCSRDHLDMFSNADTLRLAADVRKAMTILFERVAEMGLGPKLDTFEVIDA